MTGEEGGEIIVSLHLVPITISCVECVYLGALNGLRVRVCVSLFVELCIAVCFSSPFVPSLLFSFRLGKAALSRAAPVLARVLFLLPCTVACSFQGNHRAEGKQSCANAARSLRNESWMQTHTIVNSRGQTTGCVCGQIFTLCALPPPSHTHTHIQFAVKPQMQQASLQFPGTLQSKTKQPSNNGNALSLRAFTTLSEAGVEGPGPVSVQAVPDWLQAQVDDLVEAELAAVNGRGFGLQGDEELLGTFG